MSRVSTLLRQMFCIYLMGIIFFPIFLGSFYISITGTVIDFFAYIFHLNNPFRSFLNFFSSPPSYNVFISTFSILAALIFSTALFLENKKKNITYIQDRLNKKILKSDKEFGTNDKILFNFIGKFEEDILRESAIVKVGIIVFIIILTVPLLLIFISLYFWFWRSFDRGSAEIFTAVVASLLFSLFCYSVSFLYLTDWHFSFKNELFIFEEFLEYGYIYNDRCCFNLNEKWEHKYCKSPKEYYSFQLRKDVTDEVPHGIQKNSEKDNIYLADLIKLIREIEEIIKNKLCYSVIEEKKNNTGEIWILPIVDARGANFLNYKRIKKLMRKG